MQTVISQIAFTFVDDAIALTTGFARITADLAIDVLAAARNRMMAPVDRLARACDVAGILSARDAVKTRCHSTPPNLTKPRAPRRFDIFGILATFRALRELT
jgi:hypothetical protein